MFTKWLNFLIIIGMIFVSNSCSLEDDEDCSSTQEFSVVSATVTETAMLGATIPVQIEFKSNSCVTFNKFEVLESGNDIRIFILVDYDICRSCSDLDSVSNVIYDFIPQTRGTYNLIFTDQNFQSLTKTVIVN